MPPQAMHKHQAITSGKISLKSIKIMIKNGDLIVHLCPCRQENEEKIHLIFSLGLFPMLSLFMLSNVQTKDVLVLSCV